MTTPTPRPASWRSVSLRRSAPTPRGAQEAHRLAARHGAGCALARSQHRGGRPGPRGARAAATSPPPRLPLERALRPRHRAQRRLVHRLQRLVPHRRRDARRSPHRAGRGLSLPHRLPGAGAPHRPGDAARVSARLPGVRPPPGHPDRQRPALRRRRPGQPLTPLRMVDQARDRPRAHRAGTPRTERASRAPPPHPQGGDGVAAQGQPETAAAAFDHFRHSYNNERPHEALGQRPPVRLYTPSFRPYPSRLSSPDTGPRSPCAECATTARSSGRGTESM